MCRTPALWPVQRCLCYISTTTIFNIYYGGRIYLNILCIVLKEKKTNKKRSVFLLKNVQSAILKLARQAFNGWNALFDLAFDTTTVKKSCFSNPRLTLHTLHLCEEEQNPFWDLFSWSQLYEVLHGSVLLMLEITQPELICFLQTPPSPPPPPFHDAISTKTKLDNMLLQVKMS